LGALSVLPKATLAPDNDEGRELIGQVKLMAGVKVIRHRPAPGEEPRKSVSGMTRPVSYAFPTRMKKEARLVAIGTSTGGPPALQVILSALPPDFPLPIVIVQHISVGFSSGLAGWLANVTPLKCKLGENGEIVKPGTVYIAPDSQHMTVHHEGCILLDAAGPVGGHRPSINVLFESIARNFGATAIGILLTGMGKDGAQGLKAMHLAGSYTIAQDEKSSVVFSMPATAIELSATDEILDLNMIAPRLMKLVEK